MRICFDDKNSCIRVLFVDGPTATPALLCRHPTIAFRVLSSVTINTLAAETNDNVCVLPHGICKGQRGITVRHCMKGDNHPQPSSTDGMPLHIRLRKDVN